MIPGCVSPRHVAPLEPEVGIPDESKGPHPNRLQFGVPAGDLEGGAEDLSTYEFGHDGRMATRMARLGGEGRYRLGGS